MKILVGQLIIFTISIIRGLSGWNDDHVTNVSRARLLAESAGDKTHFFRLHQPDEFFRFWNQSQFGNSVQPEAQQVERACRVIVSRLSPAKIREFVLQQND